MMAPADRRRELDRQTALDPRNPDWRQALAELFYDERQFAEAAREAQQAVALRPESEASHCLRGLARAELKDCGDETLADLGLAARRRKAGAALKMVAYYLGRADAGRPRRFRPAAPPSAPANPPRRSKRI